MESLHTVSAQCDSLNSFISLLGLLVYWFMSPCALRAITRQYFIGLCLHALGSDMVTDLLVYWVYWYIGLFLHALHD